MTVSTPHQANTKNGDTTLTTLPTIHNTALIQRKLTLKNSLVGLMIGACTLVITGCQTTNQMGNTTPSHDMVTDGSATYPSLLNAFYIQGKIGFTVPASDNNTAQSASAFYVWAQENERFAMDITGAMGIGHTVIEYNGSKATLISERTGKIEADSPETLLLQATGWEAPISQLRYWISGRPAPSDSDSQLDEQGRILTSTNGDWVADFSYKNNSSQSHLPSKIKVQRSDGHKVIMTITHSQP